jgi:hypothetical protein
MEPNWYNFADYLIETFPHLRSEVEESYYQWLEAVSNPFAHFFLEEFVLPLLLGDEAGDASLRMKAGEVLEASLASQDEDLAAAALTSIVEVLRDREELRMKAWPFLGATAREWLREGR